MYTASITILLICYGYQASSMEETPLILSGPFSVTIKEGNSAKLTCTLNYHPTNLIYTRWMKNATAINIDDKHFTEKYYVQTRKFTLDIEPVKRSDKGYYQCYIETEAKNKTSEKAWLTVNETTGEPYPICEISKPIYNLCETVHVTCLTEKKSPPDTLTFFANVTTALNMRSRYPFLKSISQDSTSQYSSKPINTMYQCSNETHRWITSEFKADKTLNNSQITCKMSNDYSDSRRCNENLKILPEEFNRGQIECNTSKHLYVSGENVEFTCTVNKLTTDTFIELHGKSHTMVYRSNVTHAWITSKFKANKQDDGLTVSCTVSTLSQPVTCSKVLNISTTASAVISNPVCDCNHKGIIWSIIILSFVILVSLFLPPWLLLYVRSEVICPGRI